MFSMGKVKGDGERRYKWAQSDKDWREKEQLKRKAGRDIKENKGKKQTKMKIMFEEGKKEGKSMRWLKK